MSSPAFAATFRPERRLVRAVLLAGGAALAAGCAIVLHLPLPAPVRALLLVAWLGLELRSLARFSRAAARLRELRLGPDGPSGICESGICRPLTLVAGSVLLERYAWLRLADPGGRQAVAVLGRDGCDEANWRRLRVFCRCRP